MAEVGLAAAGRGRLPGLPRACIAQDAAADELLGRDPLALGMLLDQQMRQRSSGTADVGRRPRAVTS